METNFTVQFKGNYVPNLGKRFIPQDAVEVQTKDGSTLYLIPTTPENALEMFLMHIQHNSTGQNAKYYEYLYSEFILDFENENMFRLAMSDFKDWSDIILGTNS